ncbi:hypothetical protein ARALYDRAFT_920430 [Arabidopsis lyrata subsp. lyrata]|uniref:BZIP domain-containing protein n=1 Tax=Arabidopsis lyrata subsp. lyrata TaxID=81972 RepID=D7MX25_ARALL|nr:hypothetical protein ARALYDRAFT_920430 [Arabidopsis lyrata subsp. lyrata]
MHCGGSRNEASGSAYQRAHEHKERREYRNLWRRRGRSGGNEFRDDWNLMRRWLLHLRRPNRRRYYSLKKSSRNISNREYARRSRMRKKKQIEELQQQVKQLMMLNHHLHEKVINFLESNHQILHENSQLKEKASSFHLLMADVLLPMRIAESNINDRNVNYLRGETSNRPTNSPFDNG